MSKPVPASVWRHPIGFLAVGFGSGLAPKAPGTFGTLAAVPIYLLVSQLSLWPYLAITLLVSLVGIGICEVAARMLGVHDHPAIVWDEIAGYLVTMIAAPTGWEWIIIGFVLFRLFDIVKPWPIRWLDAKVAGGFGIMIDDVLAGIFALLGLQLIAQFLA